MPYMVHAVKDDQTVESLKASPLTAIAKARLLTAEGWSVQITDDQSQTFGPAEFNCLLATRTENGSATREERT